MKGYEYEGLSDREILVSILEKVETLFICVNDQKVETKDIEERLRKVEIYGSQPTRDNTESIKKNSIRIGELETFKATCTGADITAEKIAKDISNKSGLVFGIINLALVIVTIIVMYIVTK